MPTKKRRAPWGATQKQAEEFSKERVLRNRAVELERENANLRGEQQRLTEALVRANRTVSELRSNTQIGLQDPAQITFRAPDAVHAALVKLAGTGLWGETVHSTAEQIVRLYIREGLASGKVPLW